MKIFYIIVNLLAVSGNRVYHGESLQKNRFYRNKVLVDHRDACEAICNHRRKFKRKCRFEPTFNGGICKEWIKIKKKINIFKNREFPIYRPFLDF